MAYTLKQKLCPSGLKNNPNRNLKSIDYITIHNTGNYSPTANAASHADYQYTGSGGRQASWHYTVDDKEVWQSFDDERECWHAGDGNNGLGNYTSIGIEICVNDQSKFALACAIAAELTADLLKKHNLTPDKVVQHNKWSGKDCPAELRSGKWGVTWADFIGTIETVYRPAPAASGTPIMGVSILTPYDLSIYLAKHNPRPKLSCTVLELAKYYIDEGGIEGVRGDVAFCQAIHETGWFNFGGQVSSEQNNYCGLGAVNGGAPGAWFQTPRLGVKVHIQHLKAYASKEPLKQTCVDPRFSLVARGCAPCWEDLNGKWAVPGTTYGQSILKLYDAALNERLASLPDGVDMAEFKINGRVYTLLRIMKEDRNYIQLDALKQAGFTVEWDEVGKMPVVGVPR